MEYKPEEDLANYSYEPESDVEDDVPLAESYPEAVGSTPAVPTETAVVEESVAEPPAVAPSTQEFEPNQKPTYTQPISEALEVTEMVAPTNYAKPIEGATPVEGFQLVQASGLTDTSTPAPKGSSIPEYATATPVPHVPLPHTAVPTNDAPLQPPMPFPPSISRSESNPLDENSKSKQFNARTDFMISEFFSRQVARLTMGAPGALERGYR